MERAVVITNPMIATNKSSEVTLSKFLRVISPCYSEIVVIGGNVSLEADLCGGICVESLPIKRSAQKIKRIFDIAAIQFKMSKKVKQYIKKGTPVYFWIGDKMILPYLKAKSKKADIRYFVYGNVVKEGKCSLFKKLSAKLIAYMANHASSLCVESPGVVNEWEGFIKNDNIRKIHLYTETGAFVPVQDRSNIFGMLCRLTPGKHILECITAFAEIKKKYPDYKLEIIGSGPQEEECKALVKSLDAEDYIILHGWIDHNKVTEITSRWKYLLFISDTEGMPNSVLESMGQGVPVISTAVGGVRDIIQHGKNGWILKDISVSNIANSIISCIENENEYNKICENAKETIINNFTIDAARKNAMKNC